eukprot:Em0001g3305a
MSVCRSTVMMLLAVMDPEGTRQRKMHRLQRRTYENMGPNWCWHMDGYDKLKPYGFPIHACIDGFSRKIIWLELSTTNNDPGVVAQYYLTAVFQLGGCPARMRSDHGTENVTIATCQMAFRHYHGDRYAGANSFIFGSSIRNCDPPKRIKSKNDSTVFQKKVMEYLNQQSKSSSTDAATKEPILTREKLINKYQACTSAKRRSSDRDQRSTEESLFGMKVCQMEKTRNKTYKRIGDCLRVSGFRSTDTYKDTLQKATSSFDDAAQADAGTLIISMGRVANCPLQNGKPWTLGGYLDELGGSRRITIGVYLPNDTSSDEQSSGTPQQGRAVYKASYHFKVINCTPMFPKISFAQKGSGGNLVTGCTHQAKSGTKVALACLGCDQTCHYHDAVMGLTWLVRVEARRVPPAIDV